jgi:hypothetical protein
MRRAVSLLGAPLLAVSLASCTPIHVVRSSPATPTATETTQPVSPQSLVLTLADLGAGYTADSANTHVLTGITGGAGYQAAFLGTPEETGTDAVKSVAMVFPSSAAAQTALASGVAALAAESQAQQLDSVSDLGSNATVYSFVGTDGGNWLSIAWQEGNDFLLLGVEYRATVTDSGPLVAMARIMDRSARVGSPSGSPVPTGNPHTSSTPKPTRPATPRPTPVPTVNPNTPGGCFGCVTITDITVYAYAASPDVSTSCLPPTTDLGPSGQLIGPNVADPNRTFQVTLQITVASDGESCGGDYSGTVRLHTGSGPPLEISSISPSDPFALEAGSATQIVVTVHVPEGNTYDGPLGLDIYVGD